MPEEPDAKQPDEEELSIDGIDPQSQSSQTSSSDENYVNKIESHIQHLDISPGASNEDILDAFLSAPSEQIIPWEECHLPSRGLYYGWPDGTINVKAMNQTAEKILATQRLATSGQSIDYLFRECCKFPEKFDSTELLVGDRIFLLYFLRGITHGNMYEFAVTCPADGCEKTNTHAYDLNDLAATIKPANPNLGNEPFRIKLPILSEICNHEFWVSVRFLRAYDANDMMARRRSRNKIGARPGGVKSKAAEAKRRAQEAHAARNQAVDPRNQQRQNVMLDNTLDDNMDKVIVDIMGSSDRLKIRNAIQRFHARDTATIREWLRDNTPGIDNTVEIVCPDCGHEFTVELPITDSFFRPSKT